MDQPDAPAPSRNLFEKNHHPAALSGARYQWYRRMFRHELPDERAFDLWLIAAILASVAVVLLDSVPAIKARWHGPLYLAEWFFTLLFTVEYAARLWVLRDRSCATPPVSSG